MILTNMTPQEKLAQVEKIMPRVESITDRHLEQAYKILKRATRHPAFVFLPEKEFDGMGKWTVVLFSESKSHLNKRLVSYMAFQKYSVSHSRNPLNNGMGIYHVFPSKGAVELHEYPPHYFNRLRQRYIEKKGIVQPNFNELVKESFRINNLCMRNMVDGEYLKEKGIYDEAKECGLVRRDGYDNFVIYHQCGITLGISAENTYFNHTTFVSNDLLRKGQLELQKQAKKELRGHHLGLRYDATLRYEQSEIMKDIDM